MRGILRGGQVVVLDEPLAGLDENTRKKVLRFISDFCKNVTLIIITHDKDAFQITDRVLEFGTVNLPVQKNDQESMRNQSVPEHFSVIERLTNFFGSA